MQPRDFDAAVREARREPVSFVLGGQTFSVPSPLPGAAYLEFIDRGETTAQAFMGLICAWLGDDQATEFRTAYKRSGGDVQLLIDIANYLVEAGSGRPTPTPLGWRESPSMNGATTSGESGVTPDAGPVPTTLSGAHSP
jgi:hypothetical protein